YSFALTGGDGDAAWYGARESANAPTLIVTPRAPIAVGVIAGNPVSGAASIDAFAQAAAHAPVIVTWYRDFSYPLVVTDERRSVSRRPARPPQGTRARLVQHRQGSRLAYPILGDGADRLP